MKSHGNKSKNEENEIISVMDDYAEGSIVIDKGSSVNNVNNEDKGLTTNDNEGTSVKDDEGSTVINDDQDSSGVENDRGSPVIDDEGLFVIKERKRKYN